MFVCLVEMGCVWVTACVTLYLYVLELLVQVALGGLAQRVGVVHVVAGGGSGLGQQVEF